MALFSARPELCAFIPTSVRTSSHSLFHFLYSSDVAGIWAEISLWIPVLGCKTGQSQDIILRYAVWYMSLGED